MSTPANLIEFLAVKLDERLEREPDDAARAAVCLEQSRVWAHRQQCFWETDGDSEPGPHPQFGSLTAWDFPIIIGMLEDKAREFTRSIEVA